MNKKSDDYEIAYDLDHVPEIAAALAKTVVAWSNAEVSLARVLSKIMDINDAMATTTLFSLPTFRGRIQLIKTEAEHFWPNKHQVSDLNRIIERLNKYAARRNNLIHGTWIVSKADPEKLRLVDFRETGQSTQRSKPIKATEIREHAINVLRCSFVLAAWPDKPDAQHLPPDWQSFADQPQKTQE